MTRKSFSVVAALFLAAALFGFWWLTLLRPEAAAGTNEVNAPDQQWQGEQGRQRQSAADAPDAPQISFIDSPTAQCYLPVSGTGDCYLTWQYLRVSAGSSSYIISMTVSIDGRLRAAHQGFFQSGMYVPGDLYQPGLKVACGSPGDGGDPKLGRNYSYTIRARDSAGLKAANYGSVLCPADLPPLFLPLLSKP